MAKLLPGQQLAEHQPAHSRTSPKRTKERPLDHDRPVYDLGNQALQRLLSRHLIQAKLTVGQPDDEYEREADRVADQVIRIPDPLTVPDTPLSGDGRQDRGETDQRKEVARIEASARFKTGRNTSDDKKLPPSLEKRLRSPECGQPLSPASRAFFEPRFGHDFGRVRLHTSQVANQAAAQLRARAFTHDTDVYFARPESVRDRHLLAHELVHVVQQSSGSKHRISSGRLRRNNAEESLSADISGREHLPSTLTRSGVRIARDDLDAGVEDPADEAKRRAQVECIKRLGGCPSTRPAGIPSAEELEEYDQTCRQETAYSGPAVIPSDEECTGGRLASNAPVSIELLGAPPGTTPSERVKKWLQKYRSKIIGAERRFQIDRRAISGAIAWEALKNTYSWYGFGFARFRGPGKVHYKEGYVFEGDPVAKQVEKSGYLPKQSKESREKVLSTISGSVLYIGAIMRAFADVAAKAGYRLNCDPPMLTTFFNAWDLNQVKALFRRKKAPEKLAPNDKMGGWVAKNLPYLEGAVGKPGAAVCAVPGSSGQTTQAPTEQSSAAAAGTASTAGAVAVAAGVAAGTTSTATTSLIFSVAQTTLTPKRWANRNSVNAGAADTRTNITIGGPANSTIDVTHVRQDTLAYGHTHTNEPTGTMIRRFKHGHLTNKADGKGGRYNDFQIDGQGNQRTITYHAPHAAGQVLLSAQIRGRSDAAAKKAVSITTRVSGLQAYTTSHPNEVLVGQTANHGTNHWGTTNAISEVRRIVDAFRSAWVAAAPAKTTRDPDDAPTIRINDFSLQYGGVYDFKDNWRNPHQTHRFGNDIDISRRVIRNGVLTYLKPGQDVAGQLYQMLNTAIGVEPEDANHWHVDV